MNEELALAVRRTCLSLEAGGLDMREKIWELIAEIDKLLACMNEEDSSLRGCRIARGRGREKRHSHEVQDR